MTNDDMIQQLTYRRNRIDDLLCIQTNEDAKTLLSVERMYVETQIDLRRKHGGLHFATLTPTPA